MSGADISPALDLLRKVLYLEIRQSYQNRSTSGAGVHAFFRLQFERYDHDERSATTAESVLAYLRRYEAATSVEERARLVQVMLRRLDATQRRGEDVADEPPVAPHPADVSPARSTPIGRMPGTRTPHDTLPPRLMPVGEPALVAAPLVADLVQSPVIAAYLDRHSEEPDEATDEEEELEVFDEDEQAPAIGNSILGAATPVLAAPTGASVPSLGVDAAAALDIRKQEQGRLATLGITTLRTVLEYWPRDHYDYSAPTRINRMYPEMQTTLVGTLRAVDMRRLPKGNVQIVEARVGDASGVMTITWFNQPYVLKTLKPRLGQEVAISGKVELYNGRLQLVPRDIEFPADDEEGTNTRRIVPIYPSSEGIAQRWIRKLVSRALAVGGGLVADAIPEPVRQHYHLLERRTAVAQYHFPDSLEARTLARNRLALDELLLIQLGMQQRKRQWQSDQESHAIPRDAALLDRFRAGLPFTLTGAQERALGDIVRDMDRAVPMSRLLQGDVGSGKTVVAAAALLACAHAGMQGTIMAPTEILAEQHARTLTAMLAPHGIMVALLTGSLSKAQRARIYMDALLGKIQVLAGTHALIQEEFKFKKLGLAIVDEQHRFGVVQRAALKGKGYNPHLLVMTATPIPRTLTLTLYGDLDVSVIDERPPNRQPVETRWIVREREAYELVRAQIAEGRQAFIICPLVEESENLEAKAAVAEVKRLQSAVFPDLRLDVLHGKMRSVEKDEVLGRFRDGAIDVLVATSVVEVGIDVPNATVMVVQDAQRFGLAQLHQFRGRVGRGAAQSYCLLLAEANNPIARERLQALCATDDGFKLAEEDLRLRGPGEFWGTRQSGLPALQVANVTDMPTLELARSVAETILADDPLLDASRHALLAENLRRFWETASAPS